MSLSYSKRIVVGIALTSSLILSGALVVGTPLTFNTDTGITLSTAFATGNHGCTNKTPTASVNEGNATLTVPSGACPMKVTFASYSFDWNQMPLEDQVLLDHITDTYGPGTYDLGPLDLACNWQTDIYVGDLIAPIPHDGIRSITSLLASDVLQHNDCTPKPAPSCLISASPSGTITSGSSVTFTWTSTNADSASLSNGIGSVSVNGSRSVTASEDKTYTLTVTGNGQTRTCSTTIDVQEVITPSCTLRIDADSIKKGNSTSVSWNSQNAVSATIDSGIGSVALDGWKSIYPDYSRTYTMTVTSSTGHTATCSDYIYVDDYKPAPSCTLDINPSYITEGQSANMNWTSQYAEQVSIDTIGSVAQSGSRTIYPTYSRSYTMTVTNSDGKTAQCTDSISVNTYVPPPITPSCYISANPTSIQQGSYTTLSWQANNASSIWIDNGVGPVTNSGVYIVRPNTTTTYRMTVNSNNGGTRTCDVTIGVYSIPTPPPPITSVTLTQIPYTGPTDALTELNIAALAGITISAMAGATLLAYRRRDIFGFN